MKLTVFILLLTVCAANAPKQEPHTHPAPELTISQVVDTCAAFYKIPKAVIWGVGISETGLGVGGVGASANNLFGIKAYKDWKGERHGKWRKYAKKTDSVKDFCIFVKRHYPHLFGRPVEKWLLHGYGNSKYEKVGYFKEFE